MAKMNDKEHIFKCLGANEDKLQILKDFFSEFGE
jgi:hypothetical protein